MNKTVKPYLSAFTLIEMLTTILIIGVIAAVAIPSYVNYAQRTNRTQAITVLREIQLLQEEFRSQNTTYGTIAQTYGATTTENGLYTLDITGISGTGYTATATAQGSQLTDEEGGVSCTPLTLVVTNGVDTVSPAACW